MSPSFYTFETAGPTVTVLSPDDPDGTPVPAMRVTAGNITQITGIYRDLPFALAVIEEACRDDITGLPYFHAAAMTMGMRMTAGCAHLTTEPQPREGG